jgi:uncharacterized membrane protein
MMSAAPGYPTQTVSGLQANTFWDGLFHIGTWIAVAVGTFLLFRRSADRIDGWALLGWIIAGWGIFDVVEGVVDHEILGIHHVRDDLGGPVAWDVGFLVFGLALVVIGAVIVRWAARRHLPDASD